MKFNRQKHLDETRATRIDKNGHNRRLDQKMYEYEREKRSGDIFRRFPELDTEPKIITSETPDYKLVYDTGKRDDSLNYRYSIVVDDVGRRSRVSHEDLIWPQDDDIKNGKELFVCKYDFRFGVGFVDFYKKRQELDASRLFSIVAILLFIAGHIFLAIVTGG
jgi:hypothetical protein